MVFPEAGSPAKMTILLDGEAMVGKGVAKELMPPIQVPKLCATRSCNKIEPCRLTAVLVLLSVRIRMFLATLHFCVCRRGDRLPEIVVRSQAILPLL